MDRSNALLLGLGRRRLRLLGRRSLRRRRVFFVHDEESQQQWSLMSKWLANRSRARELNLHLISEEYTLARWPLTMRLQTRCLSATRRSTRAENGRQHLSEPGQIGSGEMAGPRIGRQNRERRRKWPAQQGWRDQ